MPNVESIRTDIRFPNAMHHRPIKRRIARPPLGLGILHWLHHRYARPAASIAKSAICFGMMGTLACFPAPPPVTAQVMNTSGNHSLLHSLKACFAQAGQTDDKFYLMMFTACEFPSVNSVSALTRTNSSGS